MRILIACEYTGIVRDCFLALGHDAVSCDIDPTEIPGPHIQDNVLDHLNDGWDMMIAHARTSATQEYDGLRIIQKDKLEALEFVTALWNAPIEKVCIENPVGCISTRLSFMPKPQYIQPYEFGENASKKTGLWTRGLPPLSPTEYVEPRQEEYKGKIYNRWANQAPCGADSTSPSKTRGKDRSRTYFGIAAAMANQWSL